MNRDNYGEKYNEHFIEQYKLYVELADRISTRRNKSNLFYTSLLSGLLAFTSLIFEKDLLIDNNLVNSMFLVVSIAGLVLCITWFINIRSYRQLSSAKWKEVQEMEKQLPTKCFTNEWNEVTSKNYLKLTFIEQVVPIVFITIYSFFIISQYKFLFDFISFLIGIGIGFISGWYLKIKKKK